jgi:DNA-directed RNA polymerase alpha subunit
MDYNKLTHHNDFVIFHDMETNHISPILGNIFAELGFKDEEAVDYLLDSSRRIRAKFFQESVIVNPKVDELPFRLTTRKVLQKAGIDSLRDLCKLTFSELQVLDGIGKQRVHEIVRIMLQTRGGFLPPYPKEFYDEHFYKVHSHPGQSK